MLIGVDADETIFDFLTYMCLIYNYKYNANLKREDIIQWDLTPYIGKHGRQIFKNKGFFKNLKPFPNAIETLKELSQKHEILIITCPPNGITAWEKYEAFNELLPFIPQDNIIMAKKKEIINVDVIIEDSPEILEKHNAITIGIDRPYNRHVKCDYRIYNNNWLEIKKIINKIEK